MQEWLYNLLYLIADTGGAQWVYIAIAGILVISGFGLPVPEDVPLLLGGLLCGLGYADVRVMAPLCFVAVLGADLVLYLIGRRYGHHVPKFPILRRYLTEARLAKAEAAFHAHGGKTLFTARFLPGVRAAIYFTAGAFKVPYWKILCFNGGAALLSVPTLVFVGYFGAKHFDKVSKAVGVAQLIIAAVVLIAATLFIVWRTRRKRRLNATSSTPEL
jgi:membrane protein DedA with SNARE-associated domain